MIKIGLNGKQGGGKSYIAKKIARDNQNIVAFDGSNLSLQLLNLYLLSHNIDDIINATITYSINEKNILETEVNANSALKPMSTKEELETKMKAYKLRENNMDVWNAIFAKTRDFIREFSVEKEDKYQAIVVTGRNFEVLMPDADMYFYITAEKEKRQKRVSLRDTSERNIVEERENIEEGIFNKGEKEIVFDTTPYNTTKEVDTAIEKVIMPIINEKIGEKPK